MKSTKRIFFKPIYLLLALLMILFAACSKEDLLVSPTIEGYIQTSEGNSSAITSPAEGIRVYLADASQGLEVETSMVIDSMYTDAAGHYAFTSLPDGAYAVIPLDTAQIYQFDLAAGTTSHKAVIGASQKQFELNYTAFIPVAENSEEVAFTVTVAHKNVPEAGYYNVYAEREEIRFLFGRAYSSFETINSSELTTNTFKLSASYENWYEKQTNNLKIKFEARDYFLVWGCYRVIDAHTVNISIPMENYRKEYALQLDWASGDIKWVNH